MNNDTVAIALDRLKFYARDAVITLTQCICKPTAQTMKDQPDTHSDATLKINGRSYRIVKLLGEGGFSFVYLIEDTSHGRFYALKKILVTSGQEGVKEAMREVEAYRRFRHKNIIKILDSAVVQDEAGEGKIIYLFLPFYSKGNLQDEMTRASVSGHRMPEKRLLELFHGTCLAVRAMHTYRLPAVTATYPPREDDDVPLMAGPSQPIFEHDDEVETATEGEMIPYAHRDIKPANVMIADDGSPVLMDFGSTIKARIEIQTRQQALLEQDIASEHSTMPYRAPELFDVKTGKTLDEKVDIWSLGCTLFAVAYGHSPFETDGASIAMAVGSGRYRHPADSPYSENLRKLIDAMLVVDPEQRPDIHAVISQTEQAIKALP